MLALKLTTSDAGEGCGGKKLCATESEASIGMATYTAGNLY